MDNFEELLKEFSEVSPDIFGTWCCSHQYGSRMHSSCMVWLCTTSGLNFISLFFFLDYKLPRVCWHWKKFRLFFLCRWLPFWKCLIMCCSSETWAVIWKTWNWLCVSCLRGCVVGVDEDLKCRKVILSGYNRSFRCRVHIWKVYYGCGFY